jgi:hypothetical protein
MGVEWPVVDFNGKVKKGGKASTIQYNVIQDELIKDRNAEYTVQQGFDAIQAAAYLNSTENYFQSGYTQIWYEDPLSLKMKFEWALENNLAGVSIMDLGADDGYTDLWDVLALTLITTVENPITYNPEYIKDCNKDVISKIHDYWGSLEKIVKGQFFDSFQRNPDVKFKEHKDSLKLYTKIKSDFKWSNETAIKYKTKEYLPSSGSKERYLLKDETTCKCLLRRWYFYSDTCFVLSGILLLLILYFYYKTYQFNRFRTGITQLTYERYKILILLLPLPVYFMMLAGLFLYPNFNLILDDKNGISEIKLIAIVAVGIIFGGFLLRTYFNGLYIKKNMP